MRLRRPLAAVAVAVLSAVPACDGADDRALPQLVEPAAVAATPVRVEPPAQLCDAIPGDVVAEATGRPAVTVDGAGTHCSWRDGTPGPDGHDVVLQGSFIDPRSFEVGRRDAAAGVPGLGDDAYLVDAGDAAPPTLYVLAGSRAFALWLGDPAAAGAEAALAHLARRVLAT